MYTIHVITCMVCDTAGGISVTPPTDNGSGSGGGPITRECYSEGSVNPSLLDYDYDGLMYSVEGPIEICIDGQYESLCDLGWDEVDAKALCRQLIGSSNGMQLYNNINFKDIFCCFHCHCV